VHVYIPENLVFYVCLFLSALSIALKHSLMHTKAMHCVCGRTQPILVKIRANTCKYCCYLTPVYFNQLVFLGQLDKDGLISSIVDLILALNSKHTVALKGAEVENEQKSSLRNISPVFAYYIDTTNAGTICILSTAVSCLVCVLLAVAGGCGSGGQPSTCWRERDRWRRLRAIPGIQLEEVPNEALCLHC